MVETKYVISNGYDSFIELEIDTDERNVMRVLEHGDIEYATLLKKEVAEEYVGSMQSGEGKFWTYEVDENIDIEELRVIKVTLNIEFE